VLFPSKSRTRRRVIYFTTKGTSRAVAGIAITKAFAHVRMCISYYSFPGKPTKVSSRRIHITKCDSLAQPAEKCTLARSRKRKPARMFNIDSRSFYEFHSFSRAFSQQLFRKAAEHSLKALKFEFPSAEQTVTLVLPFSLESVRFHLSGSGSACLPHAPL